MKAKGQRILTWFVYPDPRITYDMAPSTSTGVSSPAEPFPSVAPILRGLGAENLCCTPPCGVGVFAIERLLARSRGMTLNPGLRDSASTLPRRTERVGSVRRLLWACVSVICLSVPASGFFSHLFFQQASRCRPTIKIFGIRLKIIVLKYENILHCHTQ
jgi:hypothetical protein